MSLSIAAATTTAIYDATERDTKYNGNFAQYLIDLDSSRATFNFCGGMMFELVLSKKLKEHLSQEKQPHQQVKVHDSTVNKMQKMSSYTQTHQADNIHYFHGREIRKVKGAKGGRGFVLQLSLANSIVNGKDPEAWDAEGWTKEEIESYDGWSHDGNRDWRALNQWEEEGVSNTFREKFGNNAYGLHHRFYFHFDNQFRFWLAAEDGCEGFATSSVSGSQRTSL